MTFYWTLARASDLPDSSLITQRAVSPGSDSLGTCKNPERAPRALAHSSATHIEKLQTYVPASVLGLLFIAAPRLVERSMTLSGALRPVNAALLMGLALGGGFPAKVLSTRAAVYLGKASYSLYILHIPLLWWFKRTWLYTSGYIPQGLLALIYVAAAITLSGVACSYFEEPANRRIRGWVAGRFEHKRG